MRNDRWILGLLLDLVAVGTLFIAMILIGGIACLLGLALWIFSHGVLVGITIALTLWMLVFALLPYLAPRPNRRERHV